MVFVLGMVHVLCFDGPSIWSSVFGQVGQGIKAKVINIIIILVEIAAAVVVGEVFVRFVELVTACIEILCVEFFFMRK